MLSQERSSTSSPTRIKGTVMRGYVQALDRLGWRSAVVARISPEARAMTEQLPLDSSWIGTEEIEELAIAVHALHGPEGVRRMARESLNQSVIPLLKIVIEGFIRLFGATPATLLSRMGHMTASTAKGVEYVWTSTGPNSGTLLIVYPGRKQVPIEMFIGTAGSLETTFDLCRVRGRVEDPVPSPAHPGYGATIAIRWDAPA